jgi:hypothetical protein
LGPQRGRLAQVARGRPRDPSRLFSISFLPISADPPGGDHANGIVLANPVFRAFGKERTLPTINPFNEALHPIPANRAKNHRQMMAIVFVIGRSTGRRGYASPSGTIATVPNNCFLDMSRPRRDAAMMTRRRNGNRPIGKWLRVCPPRFRKTNCPKVGTIISFEALCPQDWVGAHL